MINTLAPAKTSKEGNPVAESRDQRGEILERISKQYGAPEEKKREAVKKLGKDEFFKIMITQMQHQDPLKPAQNEQMAAQMAQFSALEQMTNVNQNLEKLTNSQQPLHQLGATHLIGKFVGSDSSVINHNEGKYSNISFNLKDDAANVKVSLLNDRGQTVKELELKNLKKGDHSIDWDGKKDNNLNANSGMYRIVFNAKDIQDKAVTVDTAKTERVHGVGFEGKEVVLFVGDVTKPQKMLLRNVSKVIDATENKTASAIKTPTDSSDNKTADSIAAENIIKNIDRNVAGYVPNKEANFQAIDVEAIRNGQKLGPQGVNKEIKSGG
jgi:flagellar basal-body rod modification protein FlgD